MKTPRWLPRIVNQIGLLAQTGDVLFTLKALRELSALELGLDESDVCQILEDITEADFRNRIVSSGTHEYLYIFAPLVAGVEVYLKIVIRASCVVISFHEDIKNED